MSARLQEGLSGAVSRRRCERRSVIWPASVVLIGQHVPMIEYCHPGSVGDLPGPQIIPGQDGTFVTPRDTTAYQSQSP
jgi:hypothetical protein